VGRVVFFEGESGKYLNNNFTANLHLSGKYDLVPMYVFYFMYIHYWIGGTKKYEGKTTGIHNLKLNDFLNDTKILLPPIELQHKFEKFARKCNLSKSELNQSILNLNETTRSILAENFN
jgi:type I restriction enzyme S subunit